MNLTIKNYEWHLNKLNKAVYFTFFISAVVYLFSLPYRPYPFSYIMKIIPILCLLYISLKNHKGIDKIFIPLALVFSAVGDVLLALHGKGLFVFGLLSFAAAHIMYVTVFLKVTSLNAKKVLIILAIVIFSFLLMYKLYPNLKGMLLPVVFYITVITTMAVSTVLGKNNNFIIIGALFFMISDSLIAINMFLIKIVNSSLWILLTYYLAQLLIVFGTSLKENNRNSV